MNIGFLIGRIGGVDGVALETEKWIHVLRNMGHEVFILSGEYERPMDSRYESLLPIMSFFSQECVYEQDKAFYHPDKTPDELIKNIRRNSRVISQGIISWAQEQNIDLLVSENASGYAAHLSMGLGIKKAVESLDMKIVTHDHDFHWERGDRFVSKHEVVNAFIDETFPLQLDNVLHAVINTNAYNTLTKRFNARCIKVPNVMDFDMMFGNKTKENSDFLSEFGLTEENIILLQPTRIVARKGIETAIELLYKLDDPKVILMITGTDKDSAEGEYMHKLKEAIDTYGVEDQILFVGDRVKHCESFMDGSYTCQQDPKSPKIYSLSDAYAYAHACTYFSTYEGFGNAFVEAVLAKKPVFVNDYKPVFTPDIGSKGFDVVLLKDNQITDESLQRMKDIIYNPKLQKEIAEKNFLIGKKNFSYNTLESLLQEIVNS